MPLTISKNEGTRRSGEGGGDDPLCAPRSYLLLAGRELRERSTVGGGMDYPLLATFVRFFFPVARCHSRERSLLLLVVTVFLSLCCLAFSIAIRKRGWLATLQPNEKKNRRTCFCRCGTESIARVMETRQ